MAFSLALDGTLGSLFLALIISTFLFGITCLQVYLYYQWYPKDGLVTKLFVALALIMDALSIVFAVHLVYRFLVTDFGNYLALLDFEWDMKAQIIITSATPPTIQSMYALRVWKLRGKNHIVPLALFVFILGVWANLTVAIRDICRMTSLLDEAQVKTMFYAGNIISAFADVYIVLALAYFLYRPKRTFSLTASLIHNLILWIVGTGLLTFIGTIICIALYVALPSTLSYYATDIILSKLYINGFLVMLNVRRKLRSATADEPLVLSTLRAPPHIQASNSYVVDISAENALESGEKSSFRGPRVLSDDNGAAHTM